MDDCPVSAKYGQRRSPRECNGLQNAASSELVSYLRKSIPNQGNAECVAFAINRGAALLRAEVRSYGRTENAVKRAAG